MRKLVSQHCSACEIGAPLVSAEDQKIFLKDLDGWEIDSLGIEKLVKKFNFNNYYNAIQFSNCIADLAESEGHHPKIILEWGLVTLEWWSHKIKGLHKNDFICTAKSDQLFHALDITSIKL